MILAAVEARLKEKCDRLKTIAGAAEFAALEGAPPRHQQPAAWVMPTQESAGQATFMTGGIRQQETIRVAVVLALGNLRDPRGASATRAIETLLGEVKAALFGWQPPELRHPMIAAGGRTLGLVDGVVWWQADFTVNTHLRA